MASSKQSSPFPLIAGVILVGLGGSSIFVQLVGGSFWAYFWPFIILGIGVTFVMAMVVNGRGAGGLAIPGTVVTTIGTILLIQNTFGWWESWAYVWTLIVVAVGVGIYLMGYWNQVERAQRTGLMIAGIGTALFLIFGAFFGLGFNFGFSLAMRIVWPLALIGGGLFLILRWSILLVQRSSAAEEPSVLPASADAMDIKSEQPQQVVVASSQAG